VRPAVLWTGVSSQLGGCPWSRPAGERCRTRYELPTTWWSRGAREAVTNVLRHSRATSCTITLHMTGGKAELEVVNDGVLDEVGTSDCRPGTGLTGLGERLTAAGGSLETRRDGSRFALTASLPAGAAR
jgi:signal transduction histidine kinase